jgi:hypothetical protein
MALGFVFGLALGVVVGFVIARLWQGRAAVSGATVKVNASVVEKPLLTDGSQRDQHVVHLTHEVVKRRIETRLTPDGLTILVDGTEYHRLADIPDRTVADEVGDALAMAARSVTDPAVHAALDAELRAAGIDLADPLHVPTGDQPEDPPGTAERPGDRPEDVPV